MFLGRQDRIYGVDYRVQKQHKECMINIVITIEELHVAEIDNEDLKKKIIKY